MRKDVSTSGEKRLKTKVKRQKYFLFSQACFESPDGRADPPVGGEEPDLRGGQFRHPLNSHSSYKRLKIITVCYAIKCPDGGIGRRAGLKHQ